MPKEIQHTALISDANLEGYYRFNSGALTTDSSGDGETLTDVGSVASGVGRFGGGADLGASNTTDWFYVNSAYGIDGGAVTCYMWVKLQTEITSGTYKLAVFCSNNTSKTYYKIEYDYNGGTRRLRFSRVKAGVASQETTYNITLGTTNWNQIVFTYDATNMRGYVNGSLVAGPTAASGSGSSAVSNISFFGNGSTGVSDDPSSAIFDDVAIFSRALSATEISNLYSGSSASFFNMF